MVGWPFYHGDTMAECLPMGFQGEHYGGIRRGHEIARSVKRGPRGCGSHEEGLLCALRGNALSTWVGAWSRGCYMPIGPGKPVGMSRRS